MSNVYEMVGIIVIIVMLAVIMGLILVDLYFRPKTPHNALPSTVMREIKRRSETKKVPKIQDDKKAWEREQDDASDRDPG